MEKNFIIHQGIEIIIGDIRIDLHNCYALGKINVNFVENIIDIEFIVLKKYAKMEDPDFVTIKFSGIKFLEIIPRSIESLMGGIGIDSIGYKYPSDTDLEWLLEERHYNSNTHIVFFFSNSCKVDGLVNHLEYIVTAHLPPCERGLWASLYPGDDIFRRKLAQRPRKQPGMRSERGGR